MVHSIKGDKGKQYPKCWGTVPWYTVSSEIRVNSIQRLGHSPMIHSIEGDQSKQNPKIRDIVPWYTVSRAIRVNNTQSFGV